MNVDLYASHQDYIEAVNLPPHTTKIAALEIKTEPQGWQNAVAEGYPPFPEDGILCLFISIPSSMKHTPMDKARHTTTDAQVMIAFSSKRHDHLGATGSLEYIFG